MPSASLEAAAAEMGGSASETGGPAAQRASQTSGGALAAARALPSSGGALAAVQLTRFVLKEASGPQRGKTIPPRLAFAELGLAVPPTFEASGARVGAFFSEAFEVAVASEHGRRQSLSVCGC